MPGRYPLLGTLTPALSPRERGKRAAIPEERFPLFLLDERRHLDGRPCRVGAGDVARRCAGELPFAVERDLIGP
jgi:hypothetical protein